MDDIFQNMLGLYFAQDQCGLSSIILLTAKAIFHASYQRIVAKWRPYASMDSVVFALNIGLSCI